MRAVAELAPQIGMRSACDVSGKSTAALPGRELYGFSP